MGTSWLGPPGYVAALLLSFIFQNWGLRARMGSCEVGATINVIVGLQGTLRYVADVGDFH